MNHASTHAAVDPEAVERSLRQILQPGQVTELRAFGVVLRGDRWTHKTVSGYFDDPAKLAQAAMQIESAKGIYFIPNRLNPALLARAKNRIRPVKDDPLTSNNDIEWLLWLLIDADVIRPTGISATDEEHAAALAKVKLIREHLRGYGWPDPIYADSANGGHLLYRIDLKADEQGHKTVNDCLQALQAQFGDKQVKIDTSVDNSARIWKLYGTVGAKGDSTDDRPHRMSHIIDFPEPLAVVSHALLDVLAAEAPNDGKNAKANGNGASNGTFDLAAWMAQHCADARGPESWQGGQRWILPACRWNSDHTNGSAFIARLPGGAITAGCHHDSCKGKGWHELRDQLEPGWREQRTKGKAKGAKIAPPPPPWQPFPTAALPGIASQYVFEAASAIGCDESYVALPLLAALASAVGNTRRIRLKRSWSEPCIVWAIIVGDSGTQKSPAWDAATKPFLRRQTEAFRKYREALVGHVQEVERHKAAILQWRRTGAKSGEPPPDEPAEPIATRFIVSDTTIEALAPILESQLRGVLLSRDELAGWLGSFDRYANGKGDAANWLSMHRAGPITVDRKTGKRIIHVPRAAVSITGSIQPATLNAALGREHFEDGLAARLLLAMPPRRPKRWTEADVSDETAAVLDDLVGNLLALDFALSSDGEPEPYVIPLTPEAKSAWIEFYREHAAEAVELAGDLAAAWSKIEGYAARLALLVALAHNPDTTSVDAPAMQAGITLARWFAHEARRVYATIGESEESRELRRLIEWIEVRGGRATPRDVCRAFRHYPNAETAEAALDALVKAGRGRWETTETAGRPKTEFVLNPLAENPELRQKPKVSAETDPSVICQQGIEKNSNTEEPSDGKATEWTY